MRHIGKIISALIIVSITYYIGLRNGKYLSDNTVKQSVQGQDSIVAKEKPVKGNNTYEITSQTGMLDILIARKLGKKIMLAGEDVKFPTKKERESKIKYFDMGNLPKEYEVDMSGLNRQFSEDLDQIEAEGDMENARLEMESAE